jgi:hypothetical protein
VQSDFRTYADTPFDTPFVQHTFRINFGRLPAELTTMATANGHDGLTFVPFRIRAAKLNRVTKTGQREEAESSHKEATSR